MGHIYLDTGAYVAISFDNSFRYYFYSCNYMVDGGIVWLEMTKFDAFIIGLILGFFSAMYIAARIAGNEPATSQPPPSVILFTRF